MPELCLPFWVLICANDDHPHLAFTTADKATAYLSEATPGRWKLSLVDDRPSLVLAVADIHRQGAAAVWLDPTAGANPSDSIRLVDLMELCGRLETP